MAWKLKWALSGDRLDFQVNMRLLYVLYYGNYRGPHARGRARVTMVTRLCARVEHSVWFMFEKLACWRGSPSEPLAVAGWVSKLT